MRLAATARVPIGAVLGRDIRTGHPDGVPLLRAGVELNERYRQALLRAGVNAIYVEDVLSAGIEPSPLVSDRTREVATRAISRAYRNVQDSVATGRPLSEGTVEALADTVQRILSEIEGSGEIALALADLAGAHGYTFEHSIDVTALGLLIGQRLFRRQGWVDYRGTRRFDRLDERLSQLGLGLLLHDIGKLAVPTEILDKPGRLTDEEMALIRLHPQAGVDLLGERVAPLVSAVVLGHHERWDGTGYPNGRATTAIHQFARIAAVADVYDAMTSERVYASARAAHEAVRVIRTGAGTAFDAEVVGIFAELVAPFPPGVEVRLTDGRRGLVVSVPEGTLDRPVVRVLSGPGTMGEIALVDHPELEIEGWSYGRGSELSNARG